MSSQLAEFLTFVDPTYATPFFDLKISIRFDGVIAPGEVALKGLVCCDRMAAVVLLFSVATAHAEVASIYGGSDGLCGHKTASGERLNCAAMTAAHRRLPFGTQLRVCHSGCVTVRINDRGPWVRGRDIDLSPAAARAIGLYKTGHVTMSAGL
jgi:rare lipoprotein A